jgi:hypothetical protein
MILDLHPGDLDSVRALGSLETWLSTQSLPHEAEHPLWRPSGSRRDTRIRGVEHLTVLISTLGRNDESFAIIEWPRPFPQPWAQTRPSDGGFIVELNDGFVLPGNQYPCTRRAYRGRPGDYPLPDEYDPRYQTPGYPAGDMGAFTALAGAELVWAWLTTATLPPGIAVTMRHFGAKQRQHFGGGDL